MERDLHEFNHTFSLIERKNVTISGVIKIDSFDSEEFLIETVMGYLILKGNDLELNKLDTKEGVVSIKGLVNSFCYKDENITKNKKENSIISRLFK